MFTYKLYAYYLFKTQNIKARFSYKWNPSIAINIQKLFEKIVCNILFIAIKSLRTFHS